MAVKNMAEYLEICLFFSLLVVKGSYRGNCGGIFEKFSKFF